jgi:exopolyphosphatase/guanosine-5'-triphosphate,3'-diphosphate pyrophosphatase
MFATIDIGTNSVLLLIGKSLHDGDIAVAADLAEVTRLGQGLAHSGEISPEASARTLETLKRYHKLCKKLGAREIAVVGTAALRTASNATEFINRAESALGLKVEIISEEQEAMLTYKACSHDFGSDIMVIDIGGGSTELVSKEHTVSIPIGCVSLLEEFLKTDPPTEKEMLLMRTSVRKELESAIEQKTFKHRGALVAVAGTATTLGSIELSLEHYDPKAVHGSRLSISDLCKIIQVLLKKNLTDRREIKGLNPDRADVIVPGAGILYEAMNYLGFSKVTISDRGVKWGLFYEKFCR